MKKQFFILLFLCVSISMFSQYKRMKKNRTDYKDSCHHFFIVGVDLEGDLPYGDMSARFGGNFSAGMPILYKTSKNLIIGVEGNYFFSNNVRENSLDNMYNNSDPPTITDGNGNPASVRVNERGFSLYAVVGGVINKLGKNKNSGLLLYGGFGYMQSQIHIADIGRSLPQVFGDLKKGYDRLTGGFAAEQFIGYMYLARNRLINCYGGFTFQEGFTTGLRGYQYDTMTSDNKKRKDILIGIRIGWMLPLYKKAPKEFYYN
ncbi:MAG: hypothetical protein ABI388_07455 [Bacteroidia bacterium]